MSIETPCLKVCVLDPVRDLCEGCGRTRAEIAGWLSMSAADRRAVMQELPRRLRDTNTPERLPTAATKPGLKRL